jgi:hypothetical protein
MQKQNFHKNNHYVSQGYLKNWESSYKKIWTYRTLVSHKKVRSWNEYSLKGLAYYSYLYTQIISGEQTDHIERLLDKEFETPAEIPIIKAISDQRLTINDWNSLIRFLAAQDVRTPARLIEHLQFADKKLPSIMEDVLKKFETNLRNRTFKSKVELVEQHERKGLFPLSVSIEKIKKESASIRIETTPGRSTWLFSISHLLKNTLNILHQHKWTIMHPAKGMTWPTSDSPVIRLNFYKTDKYDFKGGWGNPGTEIMFPLSPNHLMYTQVGKRPPQRGTRFSVEHTQLIRRFIAENAHRLIFSNQVDYELELFRPRIIDQAQFDDERNQWKKWHDEQSKLESKYFSKWNAGRTSKYESA